MNTYQTQFIARCPSDGERILYDLELITDQMVMVERINETLDEITEDYQESIAQRIGEAFPHCAVTLRAKHQGVHITSTIKPKAKSAEVSP